MFYSEKSTVHEMVMMAYYTLVFGGLMVMFWKLATLSASLPALPSRF